MLETKEIEEKVAFYVKFGNSLFPFNRIENLIVMYSEEVKIAGFGYRNEAAILLNPTIEKDFLLNTVIPHEVAHQFVRKICPSAADHGEFWKAVMSSFGLAPSKWCDYPKEVKQEVTYLEDL